MPTSVALGEHYEAFVKEQLKSGRYNNASEVIRAGLRLLEELEKVNAARLAELRRLIKEGLESGEPRPAEEVFARLKSRIEAKRKARP